jgi:Cu+-exporting ATPase
MASADKAEGAVLDPICGMKIEKTHAAAQVEHDGKTYYFCMEEEKNTFLKDPAKYIKNN